MNVKKIVVPLTGAQRDESVLQTAFAAARPCAGHVVGLFVHANPDYAVPSDGMSVTASVSAEIVAAVEAAINDAEEKSRAALKRVATSEQARFMERPERTDGLSCSFRVRHGNFAWCVARESQLSDLVVFGPPSGDSKLSEGLLDTLTKIERPVLIAPQVPVQFARNIAVAWDGGVACAHAVIGALPYLERAGNVDIVSVGDVSEGLSRDDAVDYLALHGIAVRVHAIERTAEPVAERLMRFASENANDLLVMGGYGHSYLRETFFGGVTARIRWHAKLPVLMVH